MNPLKAIVLCVVSLLSVACVEEPGETDRAVVGVDAATCSGEPPDLAEGEAGLCSAPPTCAPAVCWVCAASPSGLEWKLLGDDRCR